METPVHSQLTLGELLPGFYSQYDLGKDGGVHDTKVKIEFTKHLYFYYPNWDERRRAVEKHDMHHIITGYPSTMKGESQICAWEIASGCRNYWAAWFLDMQAMGLVWFYPKATFNAFVRGLRSANLYHDTIPAEEARNLTANELRQRLHIPTTEIQPRLNEVALFVWWMAWGNLAALLSLVVTPIVLLYNAYLLIQGFFSHKNNPL